LESLALEHSKALDEYKPDRYAGDVVLFRSAKQVPGVIGSADLYLGWKDVLLGNIDVCEVPGHQENLLSEPHVAVLAGELEARLVGAQQRYGFAATQTRASGLDEVATGRA
jgi:hypothetical protein